ncbi:carbohydrate binding domain-containing protein, partial [Elusimicrobiota bacterium]
DTVRATQSAGWTHVEWDFEDADWNECDPDNVNSILFFIQPGESGTGSFRIDNISLEPDPDIYSTARNLLVDDFNSDFDTNKLGGDSGVWPNDEDVITAVECESADNEQRVHGRTGKSLQIRYGIKRQEKYIGYWSSLSSKNISNYNSITLWAMGTASGQTFLLGIKDINGTEVKIDISDYYPGGLDKDSWKKILIPLSAFGGINFTSIDNYSITIPEYLRGTFYIDDVVLHRQTVSSMLLNFDSGSISGTNLYSGNQGNLGNGTFAVDSAQRYSGGYSGKLYSGTSGLVDDFDDAGDPNEYGGSNSTWSVAPATVTLSYDNTEYYGSSGYSLKTDFDVPSQIAGFSINWGVRDMSNYEKVRFAVKASSPGVKFDIGLKDSADREPKVLMSSYVPAGIGTSWQEVSIDISDFIAENPAFDKSALKAFTVGFSTVIGGPVESSLYIDDIQFGGYDGGWVTLNNADISNDNALIFYVKGAIGAEHFQVRLQDSDSDNSTSVTVPVTTEWVRQELALSQFSGVDFSNIYAIHLGVFSQDQTIYIDEVQIGDTVEPSAPVDFRINGEIFSVSSELSIHNILTAEAASQTTDSTIEGVRFEYSPDGSLWYTIAIDYDTADNYYQCGWNATALVGQSGYRLRAAAQDLYGNSSPGSQVSDFIVGDADTIIYPNPFYPDAGTGKAHFKNIPTGCVLKVYTVSGESVIVLNDDGLLSDDVEADGLISWDGTNNAGSHVASGIYLYLVVKDGDRVESGKFVIIR